MKTKIRLLIIIILILNSYHISLSAEISNAVEIEFLMIEGPLQGSTFFTNENLTSQDLDSIFYKVTSYEYEAMVGIIEDIVIPDSLLLDDKTFGRYKIIMHKEGEVIRVISLDTERKQKYFFSKLYRNGRKYFSKKLLEIIYDLYLSYFNMKDWKKNMKSN